MKEGLFSLLWSIMGVVELIMGIGLFFVFYAMQLYFLLIIPGLFCFFGFFTLFCEIQKLFKVDEE